MGDTNPSSKSSTRDGMRAQGSRWLRSFAPALIGLVVGCADRDFERPTPEPAGGARPVLPAAAEQRESVEDFVQLVVSDLDAVWTRDFAKRGKTYAAVGPSLLAGRECAPGAECPEPAIDLHFQHSLHERFGAAGKAPQAYAIAHQVGHHVQRVLGIDTKVRELLAARPIAAYMVETQVELQADCFAGVWLRSTPERELLPPLDVERALRQASELGKELRLSKHDGKRSRDSFTYAIPRRREYWFYQGFSTGRIEECDPFSVE